ncbi:MAG: hypothetical protein P8M34_15545 [Saprospiraceae bacterium]|nr:hypothetical protein [Saprospiraceae bacterium]
MQFFEIILIIVSASFIGFGHFIDKIISTKYIIGLLLFALALQLFLNGYRWQMIPSYLIWLAAIISAFSPKAKSLNIVVKILRTIVFLVVLTLSFILPSLLPVFELPEPRGSYNVGTKLIHVQTERDEIITKDPNDKRELLYKIWYPSESDVSSLKSEKYVDKGSRAGFAMKYGLPPETMDYLDHIKTYAYSDIPVANGSFPLLIFSHGYGSKATGYYAFLTELASQGYVIINMNHTYESLGATFPDGRIKYFDYNFQREISSGGMEAMKPLIEAFKNKLVFDKRHPIVRKAVKEFYESKSVDRWAEDISTTIDIVFEWNKKGFLKNKLELDQLAVMGHSNGGGAAGMVAAKDSRVKAGVNLDGITWGNLIDTIYNIPFLYVSADWPAEHEDINSHIYINKSTDYFYESKLLKSGHPNFMDIPFMIPIQSVAGTGDIDPYLGMEIVTKLVTTFFDKHLKNIQEADPEKIDEQYELLELKIYRGD